MMHMLAMIPANWAREDAQVKVFVSFLSFLFASVLWWRTLPGVFLVGLSDLMMGA